jgi:hypothetical protein
VRGEGAAAALWVDPAVHAEECRRFDSFVVRGPTPADCDDFFIGAIGTGGYGRNRANPPERLPVHSHLPRPESGHRQPCLSNQRCRERRIPLMLW